MVCRRLTVRVCVLALLRQVTQRSRCSTTTAGCLLRSRNVSCLCGQEWTLSVTGDSDRVSCHDKRRAYGAPCSRHAHTHSQVICIAMHDVRMAETSAAACVANKSLRSLRRCDRAVDRLVTAR